MAYKDFDAYRNSTLHRKAPKSSFFQLQLGGNNEAKPVDQFSPQRRKSSSTVARVLFAIILIHLVIAGGIYLQTELQEKKDADIAAGNTQAPPPQANNSTPEAKASEPQAASTPAVLPTAQASASVTAEPTPVLPDKASASITPDTAVAANTATTVNTITPTPIDLSNEVMAVEIEEDPAPATTPTPATAPAPSVERPSRHLVRSGDNLSLIAAKYQVSRAELKAVNPQIDAKDTVYAGEYLNIPSPGGSAQASTPAAAPASDKGASVTYIIVKNDTLSSIARKHKMTTKALMELNKLTDADARRIRPGQKLIIKP